MTEAELEKDLESFRAGILAADDFAAKLRAEPFVDLGFAKLDNHREIRQGFPEVVYGEGKTSGEINEIVARLASVSSRPVMVTRIDSGKSAALSAAVPGIKIFEKARIAVAGEIPPPDGAGEIAIVTGGTSDGAVAEEAAVTAEVLGNRVVRIYDAGVAGLHRLLAHVPELQRARAVIAIAGMEGALATVVGGLVSCPVVAVPTSVGYGAAFDGLAALLSMINSCASGVSVVNIDNGFGAAVVASRINHP